MAEAVDLRDAFSLPPEDALTYFRGKGYKISRDWTDVWQTGHARYFTVAKIARRDLLETVRRSLDAALADGQTFESWKRNIIPVLEKEGWWGKVRDASVTGTAETVNITPRRLKVIYDTNLRTARAAGQWARIQKAKANRPYLRYSAVMDRRTRPAHRAWHGTILPVDHPWWNDHFPPNGWFCRCNVQQLSERDMKRLGYVVTAPPADGPARLYVSKTGFRAEVPAGIDAGFGHNPGQDFWRGLAPPALDGPLQRAAINVPVGLPEVTARAVPRSALIDGLARNSRDPAENQAALQAWNEAVDPYLDLSKSLIIDPVGDPTVIDAALWLGSDRQPKITKGGRARFLKLIAQTMAAPDEIWQEWVTDDPSKRKAGTPPKPARLIRKLMARYIVDGEAVPITVILEIGKDGWNVVTAFDPAENQYQSRRSGTLAYRRQ